MILYNRKLGKLSSGPVIKYPVLSILSWVLIQSFQPPFFGFAMFRSLAIVLALSTMVTAKDVTLLVIDKLNAGRKSPPYDNTVIVMNLAEDAKLIDVMNKAKSEGTFSLVIL